MSEENRRTYPPTPRDGGLYAYAVRRKTAIPPRHKRLDGTPEAPSIALRLGQPPQGFAPGSLRLLAEQGVALASGDAVSHEPLRQMLKKTA